MLVLWLWQKPQIASVWVDSTRAQAESLAAVVSQNEATRDDADDYRAAQKLATQLICAQATSRRQHQNSRAFSRVSVQRTLSELCENPDAGAEALRIADALTECRQNIDDLLTVKKEEVVVAPLPPAKSLSSAHAIGADRKRPVAHCYAAAAAGGGGQQRKLRRLSSAGNTPKHPRGLDFLSKCLSTSSEEGEAEEGEVYSSEDEAAEDLVLPEKND